MSFENPLGIVSTFITLWKTAECLNKMKIFLKDVSSPPLKVFDVIERIKNSSINIGDPIRIEGIFSEFIPFSSNILEPLNKMFANPINLGCRFDLIGNYYCSTIQEEKDFTEATSTDSIPVFYKLDAKRPTIELTGQMVEMSGKIIEIPPEWKKILNIPSPFGILLNEIDIVGSPLSNFYILPWVLWSSKEKGNQLITPTESTAIDFWSMSFSIEGYDKRCIFVGGRLKAYEKKLELIPANLFDRTYVDCRDYLRSGAAKNCDFQFDQKQKLGYQTNWINKELKKAGIYL